MKKTIRTQSYYRKCGLPLIRSMTWRSALIATGSLQKVFLSDLAAKLNVNIIGGSVANKVVEDYYNSSFVFNRTGKLVYEYDKVHLVPMLNEPKYLTGGTTSPGSI
ncbi:nitrilase-related carbon-nitrogen hydrolase [Virgibacillus halophilus]|uniref:Nitrilase-related carbon-nitrogen hydrolase n=1 Tax=Tigheibacillus halophilus TaxID=361280 RepID=A0ABU5C352_9BACI|nr:nitrilase-related carbon-nitrogen hydrolase [Virgibacillus halophilus]